MIVGKIKSKLHAAIGHNVEIISVKPRTNKLNIIKVTRIIVSIPHKSFGMADSVNHNKQPRKHPRIN